MKIFNRLYNLASVFGVLVAIGTVPVLYSCTADDNLNGGLSENGINPDAIRVTANISDLSGTRAYKDYGEVDAGDFVICYPCTLRTLYDGTRWYEYYFGNVTFGQPGAEKTGFIDIGTATVPRELAWGSGTVQGNGVYVTSKKASFYLSNVPLSTDSKTNIRDTIVGSSANAMPLEVQERFSAGLFDDVNGYNDLLWGEALNIDQGAPFISFPMHHVMSLVKIQIRVYDGKDDQFTIDLTDATVKIDKISKKPQTFYRLYGDIDVAPIDPSDNEIYFIGSEEETDTEGGITWISIQPGEDETGTYKIYSTPYFVFPPQTLGTGENRPVMTVTVPWEDVYGDYNPDDGSKTDYVVFSGRLAAAMYEGPEATPKTFNFLKERRVTIDTRIDPEGWKLEFVPVYVEQWVDKGEWAPQADQNGIVTAEDFYKLIDYYNENRTFQLGRYGFINSSGKWQFQFRTADLELELQKIQGKMKPENGLPPFQFDFRGRVEYILKEDGSKQAVAGSNGQTYLYNVVIGNTFGINSTADFNNLIQALKEGNTAEYSKYGNLGPDGKWTFVFYENVTVQRTAIANQVQGNGTEQLFYFDFNGNTLTVQNGTSSTVYNNSIGEVEIYNLITNSNVPLPGIYAADGLVALSIAYQSYSADLLDKYGYFDDSTDQWVFVIRANLNLTPEDLEDAQPMLLDAEGIKSDYRFDFGTYSLTFTPSDPDATAVTLTGNDASSYLYQLMSE